MYCFIDDSKDKRALGIICFENKEEVVNFYVVEGLCKGRKPTEVFEIKKNKVELKGAKLERKGIPFCRLVEGGCATSFDELLQVIKRFGPKVVIYDHGALSREEERALKKALRCKVKPFRSHLRRGRQRLCGLSVELSWEACGVQLADLVARCCFKRLEKRERGKEPWY